MQSLPLEAKILMTQRRIRDWVDYWHGDAYVSFSGGKDSTVLKHIVDGMYDDIPAVFVNTGLEYPEIQRFVREIKAGKFPCFNPDVEIIRPEMRFDEVIKKYGYPVISKEISERVYYARHGRQWALNCMDGLDKAGNENSFRKMFVKYKYLVDAPFSSSNYCCNVMKKRPAKAYESRTKRHPIIGTLACESTRRRQSWEKNGCNAYETKRPKSQPLSFWTEQDVLHYIKEFNVPYCLVYGEIQVKRSGKSDEIEGQMNIIDYLGDYEPEDVLETTGCDRTGCVFCLYGCHLDPSPNRMQRLKKTHPKQYEYCMGGGEMVDGVWQPSKDGLGLKKVMEYIGIPYE
jgi:3'-phosphoadenosine 5'-phosphosulfate sulfotransferase (PAPS reductase)/FAD synthetase